MSESTRTPAPSDTLSAAGPSPVGTRAVVFGAHGAVNVVQRSVSAPVGDQVLVRVAAAGCNRADLLQRDGRYPAPAGAPADVPGLEFAGTVQAVGDRVLALRPGDRVMGITGGGAQAQHLLVPEPLCVPVPPELDLVMAAALPEAGFTAFEALVVQGGVRTGARVFVNAVGSGIGTALVQLARALGAHVVGTTRSPDKLERALALGLDAGLVADGTEDPLELAERLRVAAGGEVDLAVDLLGGRHLAAAVEAVRVGGRVVLLGFLDGAASTVDARTLVSRRVSIVGTSLRGRPDHEKALLAVRFGHEVLPLIADGLLRPVVDRVVDLDEVRQAYELLERNATFGKLLLRMPGGEDDGGDAGPAPLA